MWNHAALDGVQDNIEKAVAFRGVHIFVTLGLNFVFNDQISENAIVVR